MEEKKKQEIELLVNKLFMEEQLAHRDYFEKIFNQFKWFVGIIVVLGVGIFGFLFGRTITNLNERVENEINEIVFKNKVDQNIDKKIDTTINNVIENSRSEIESSVLNIIESYQSTKIDSVIAGSVESLDETEIISRLLPAGTIIAFYGQEIPGGWVPCNGKNGTPNLVNRFILGSSMDDRTKNKPFGNTTKDYWTGTSSRNKGENVDNSGAQPGPPNNYSANSHMHKYIPPSFKLVYIMKL